MCLWILSEKMKIRKLTKADLKDRVRMLNTPSIANKLNVHEKFTLENTIKWFEKIQDNPSRYDVVFTDEDTVVGMAGLVNISKRDSNAEMYIYIDANHQKKGYGKRGLSLLIDYAFSEYKLNKVFVYTFVDNVTANKFYESLNFILEAHLRRHTFHKGELKDRYIYGLLKEDWE